MPKIGSGNAYDGSTYTPIAIAFALLVARSLTTRAAVLLDVVPQPAHRFRGTSRGRSIGRPRAHLRMPGSLTGNRVKVTLFSTSRLRPAISMICRAVRPLNRIHRLIPDHDRRRVVAGSPRWRRPAPRARPAPPAPGCARTSAVDPDVPRIERRVRLERFEPHDVAVVAVDTLGPVQPVAVALVEPQLQRQRQHLLGLQQRKRRAIRIPRSTHSPRTTAPPIRRRRRSRNSGSRSRRRIRDRSSSAGSAAPCGAARRSCAPARPARAAAAWCRAMTRRPTTGARRARRFARRTTSAAPALKSTSIGRAGQRHAGTHAARWRRRATKSAAAACEPPSEIVDERRALDRQRDRDAERVRPPLAPVGEIGRERLVVEQQAMWHRCVPRRRRRRTTAGRRPTRRAARCRASAARRPAPPIGAPPPVRRCARHADIDTSVPTIAEDRVEEAPPGIVRGRGIGTGPAGVSG